MILFEKLTIQIHRQPLLKAVDLHIRAGEKAVLRGASGSGKSTLLKSAVGAIPIQGGRIRIDGMNLSADTVADIRARTAFIGQEPVLGAERVQDALLLPFHFKAHRHNRPDERKIHDLLERLHLSTDVLDKPCSRISGGEKQRIAISRALLLGKTIFLADEITSALDPESRAAVMEELFRPEITLLSVSHDPQWIARGNRVIDIADHKLKEGAADPLTGDRNSEISNQSTGGDL
jgi:putative ABC transport system ATP-binding protein